MIQKSFLMLVNGRTIHRIFIPALLVGLAIGSIQGYRVILDWMMPRGFDGVNFYFYLVEPFVQFALNPVIIFVALFRLCRRIDLKNNFVAVIFQLFVAGFLGSFIGYLVGFIANPVGIRYWTDEIFFAQQFGFWFGFFHHIPSLIDLSVSSSLVSSFQILSTGFTALAITHFSSQSAS